MIDSYFFFGFILKYKVHIFFKNNEIHDIVTIF
jgi:hypothetical protein